MGSDNTKKDSFGEKLVRIEQVLDKKADEMAKIGACSVATYYRYRNGTSVPGYEFLTNILKSENSINPDWLFRDQGPVIEQKYSLERMRSQVSSENSRWDEVPYYSMRPENRTGEGAISLKEWDDERDFLPLCAAFYKHMFNTEISNIFAVRVRCDSMDPEIKPNSIVLYDKSKYDISVDGIYLLQFDEVIRMKMVQKMPGGGVLLSTINEKYKPVKINRSDMNEIEILGRAIWTGKPL